jgi:hypothetical protein
MAGSLAALAGLSTAFSTVTILPFLVASKFDVHQNPFIFPAIWASVWCLVSSLNPVGRLGAWSPLLGVGGYSWTRPYLGAVGLDWILAAWAEIVGAVFTAFLWGGDSSEYQPLEDQTQNSHSLTMKKINPTAFSNRSISAKPKEVLIPLPNSLRNCLCGINTFILDRRPSSPHLFRWHSPTWTCMRLAHNYLRRAPIYSYLNETSGWPHWQELCSGRRALSCLIPCKIERTNSKK